MRILYVTNESPIFPSGGIGTYIGYMASSMRQAGHEVFLLTWTYQSRSDEYNYWPFTADKTRICYLNSRQVNVEFPHGPYNYAVSALLSKAIIECALEWKIDVIESADFFAPCLTAFQLIQASALGHNILCCTFNHGFIEDYNDADQIASSEYTQNELTSERQQLRISDLILTPSVAARARLHRYGIRNDIVIVREPYEFQVSAPYEESRSSMQFLGRLSLSKGVDRVILLANLLNNAFGLQELLFIGKEDRIPFGQDTRSYILDRLEAPLRDRVTFKGELPRDEALSHLCAGSLFPALGSAETFSFACLEAIDRGLVPLVMSGTPMESFFPPDMRHYVLERREPDIRKWLRTLKLLIDDAPQVVARLQQYNREELNPVSIAQKVGDLYDGARRKKKHYAVSYTRTQARPTDISLLISVVDTGNIQAVIDAVCAQTVGMQHVLICYEQGALDSAMLGYIRLRLPNSVLIEQPQVGRAALYNLLLAKTWTNLCVFLDEHTVIAATFVEQLLCAYNESVRRPHAVSVNQYKYGGKTGKVIRQFMGDHIHYLRNDMILSALVETSVARGIGFDVTRRNGEDLAWAFWLAFHRNGFKHIWVPKFLVNSFRPAVAQEGSIVGNHVMVRDILSRSADSETDRRQLAYQAMFARQRTG